MMLGNEWCEGSYLEFYFVEFLSMDSTWGYDKKKKVEDVGVNMEKVLLFSNL